jgi:hypothetical protein
LRKLSPYLRLYKVSLVSFFCLLSFAFQRYRDSLEEVMLKRIAAVFGLFLVITLAACQPAPQIPEDWLVLAEFGENFSLDRVTAEGAEVSRVQTEEGVQGLAVKSGSEGLSVKITAENLWDLSDQLWVRMDLRNPGPETLYAECRINGIAWMDGANVIPPGEKKTLSALIKRLARPVSIRETLFGMNGLPGGYVWIWDTQDPKQIEFIEIRLPYIQPGDQLEISSLRAEGAYTTASWDPAGFPLLDEFGQLRDRDWPGKIHSEQELRESIAKEDADLASNLEPSQWNEYGGWAGGPTLEATGHFRTEKYQGKWWLVDPKGNLFWSHGIDCVRPGGATPVTDREHYFSSLPEDDSPLYTESEGAAREYYKGRSYRMYDLRLANLERKYGNEWREVWAERAHQRLRSWGVNTVACWSDEFVYSKRKTPYVVYLSSGGPRISGAEGFWRKFPDPFDEGFRGSLVEGLDRQKGKSTGDPWCIGYFVDNELSWGDAHFLAASVMESPPEQAAKQEFEQALRKQYRTVAGLNQAWSTDYSSWKAFAESREAPETERAIADLEEFNQKIAAQYFRVIRDEIRGAAPDKLYLGPRMALHAYPDELSRGAWLVPIAAEFCDVVSFNRYRFTCLELQLPEGIDRPVIIGEFHFGALDRGMLHTGLRSAYDQNERALLYEFYVTQALENPFLVGTHWFQLNDQAVTGRRDGENYQIGFLDYCDNPYPEMIAASRNVGGGLYRYRTEGK